MIFKSDLIDAISALNHDMISLAVRVTELEKKINESCSVSVKRGRGRPRGSTKKNIAKK